MTRQQQQANPESEHGKAAGVFTGIMVLLGGWAGLALAGVVLGLDYVAHGEPGERDHVTAQRSRNRRQRYDDALAWLEADRLDRERARKARRDWFESDPSTRGDAPSGGETAGRVLARLWNNMIVGGTRFRRGWEKGREEARRRREDGQDGWWKPERPDRPQRSDPVTPAAPSDGEPPVASGPAAGEANETDEIVDAEIVPDPEPPSPRNVVAVGEDEKTATGPVNEDYQARLDNLHGEVQQNQQTRNDNPSPPLSALR